MPEKEVSPLRELLVIAAPVVAAMTSFTLMQFVDRLMVSRIGPEPIYVGAQGNGGLLSWVPISVAMGFTTVVNTFVSQNLGAGKPERGPMYVWAALWMNMAYWLLVLLPIAFAVPWIISWMQEPTLSAEALALAQRRDAMTAAYARILLVGACITLAARAISNYFYGMHRPMVVLVATVAGNLTNIIGNSLLIYGPESPHIGIGWIDAWLGTCAAACQSLGIPRLGVTGAAIATLTGTLVELVIPAVVFLSPASNRLCKTRSAWRVRWSHFKDLFNIGWPGALMFGNEMLCWSLFMVYFVGSFGAEHSNAGWIAHQWMSLSFMPTVGISIAATATVGKYMGMKRPDIAAKRAWLAVGVAVLWMSFMGAMFLIFRREMVGLFIDEGTTGEMRDKVLTLGMGFMLATAAFQFFDAIAMTLSGALRGAGDTVIVGVLTVALAWGLIVGGSWYLVTYHPKLESQGPWIAAAAYIIVLSLVILARFLSGKWKTIKLMESSVAHVPAA